MKIILFTLKICSFMIFLNQSSANEMIHGEYRGIDQNGENCYIKINLTDKFFSINRYEIKNRKINFYNNQFSLENYTSDKTFEGSYYLKFTFKIGNSGKLSEGKIESKNLREPELTTQVECKNLERE